MNKFLCLALVATVFVAFATAAPATSGSGDKVRDRAQANYRKVVEELNNRFANYLENCFPRPKGCLCTIGFDANGREITERRKKDVDCKSKPGDEGGR